VELVDRLLMRLGRAEQQRQHNLEARHVRELLQLAHGRRRRRQRAHSLLRLVVVPQLFVVADLPAVVAALELCRAMAARCAGTERSARSLTRRECRMSARL
jgi:hypothetical protein